MIMFNQCSQFLCFIIQCSDKKFAFKFLQMMQVQFWERPVCMYRNFYELVILFWQFFHLWSDKFINLCCNATWMTRMFMSISKFRQREWIVMLRYENKSVTYLTLKEILTDQPRDRPTNQQRAFGLIGMLHFQ